MLLVLDPDLHSAFPVRIQIQDSQMNPDPQHWFNQFIAATSIIEYRAYMGRNQCIRTDKTTLSFYFGVGWETRVSACCVFVNLIKFKLNVIPIRSPIDFASGLRIRDEVK